MREREEGGGELADLADSEDERGVSTLSETQLEGLDRVQQSVVRYLLWYSTLEESSLHTEPARLGCHLFLMLGRFRIPSHLTQRSFASRRVLA